MDFAKRPPRRRRHDPGDYPDEQEWTDFDEILGNFGDWGSK